MKAKAEGWIACRQAPFFYRFISTSFTPADVERVLGGKNANQTEGEGKGDLGKVGRRRSDGTAGNCSSIAA